MSSFPQHPHASLTFNNKTGKSTDCPTCNPSTRYVVSPAFLNKKKILRVLNAKCSCATCGWNEKSFLWFVLRKKKDEAPQLKMRELLERAAHHRLTTYLCESIWLDCFFISENRKDLLMRGCYLKWLTSLSVHSGRSYCMRPAEKKCVLIRPVPIYEL